MLHGMAGLVDSQIESVQSGFEATVWRIGCGEGVEQRVRSEGASRLGSGQGAPLINLVVS